MKATILVIDDEHATRLSGYERLRQEAAETSNLDIEFCYLSNPNGLRPLLAAKAFHAVILDAVLNIEVGWKNYGIELALADIGDVIPIALVSGMWDQTNADQVNKAWLKKNCRTFIHWRDIAPNGTGQLEFAVRALIRMIFDREGLDFGLKLSENDPIWILHVSDLQTGGFSRESLNNEAAAIADCILNETGDRSPTFIAFTGDVAEYGSPIQYDQALQWLKYFCTRLGFEDLPSRRILHVPGNHDVNVSLAASSRIQLRRSADEGSQIEFALAETVVQPELTHYAYSPYRIFSEGVSNRAYLNVGCAEDSFAWIESSFRHLGVVFYGVNTAAPANPFGFPRRHIEPDALACISKSLSDLGAGEDQPPFVVGLVHHCPVSASDDSSVDNPKDFEVFLRGKIKTPLILHGHTHEHDLAYSSADGLRVVRSCATTLTKGPNARPTDTLRGLNLLKLTREKNKVTGLSARSFGWVSSSLKPLKQGSWMVRADSMPYEAL